ncbi:MAG: hypothetical protein ICV72_03485, partial [Aldersonia sp.]|nr:hypothetical protein [Aldersonia sp.]
MSDLAGFTGFARSLSHAGLPVATDSVDAFVRALREIDLADPAQVYWVGRATLCRDPDDLPLFDLAFEAWFGGKAPRPSRRKKLPRHSQVAALRMSEG